MAMSLIVYLVIFSVPIGIAIGILVIIVVRIGKRSARKYARSMLAGDVKFTFDKISKIIDCLSVNLVGESSEEDKFMIKQLRILKESKVG